MTRNELVAKIEQFATLKADVAFQSFKEQTLARLWNEIVTQIDEMYAGAAPDESFEPPMPDSPPPDGSVWYYCPKCKKHVLSAGDGCGSCGYGYDDEDLPSDEEIIAFQKATDPRYIQQDIDLEDYRRETYDNYDMTQAHIDEVNAIADQAEACCSYCDTPLSEIPNHLMRFHKDGKCEDMDTQEMQESHEIQNDL